MSLKMFSSLFFVVLSMWLTLVSSADQVEKEKKLEEEMVERLVPWPNDLEPSSQIVFRPLFVYKQRKAELHEQRRRKAELEAGLTETEEPGVPEKITQTVTWHLRPPQPPSSSTTYRPSYYYYSQRQQPYYYYYSPYYNNYNYGYYPYTSWQNRG